MQIDFTEIESTYEEYDGNDNGPRARSEVLTMEQQGSSRATGIPGAISKYVCLQITNASDSPQTPLIKIRSVVKRHVTTKWTERLGIR